VACDLDFFRTLASEKLDKERFRHTLGVEIWALQLAQKHRIDEESACLAALTHDLARQYPLFTQLAKAAEWNLLYYPEDSQIPGVIHGRLAAVMLEKEYGVTDRDILNAVANHTLGRPGMSPLEMLIYSADCTEPGRDFPGVDKLRQKLYDDLKEGTLACVEHTLHYLQENNKAVHPLSLLTFEDLKVSGARRLEEGGSQVW